MAAMFEASVKAKRIEKGQTIEGTIVAIGPEVAFVDVGGKGEATIEIDELKDAEGAILWEILPQVFAAVREVSRRAIAHRPFDVQIVGGAVLHQGKISEMATGEGKTLVATMPIYLNALPGRGVHLVTVNDYLAKRDSVWMGKVYEFLGLTVGCIQNTMDSFQRRREYACDITYGTNNEFGFDYLRDNMVVSKEDLVQRPHNYAIVDEVDSVLIDEARTPLIISGPVKSEDHKYDEMKPKVDRIVAAQRNFVSKIVAEAEALLSARRTDSRPWFSIEYCVCSLIFGNVTGRHLARSLNSSRSRTPP